MTAYLGRRFTVRQPSETPPRDPATCTHWWTKRGCYWCGTKQPEPEDPPDAAREG